MHRTFIICVGLAVLPASSLPTHAIGNGYIPSSGEYASVGAVDKVFDAHLVSTHGSAVLIAPSWVLTAAHVVNQPPASGTTYAIRLGTDHYEIASIILHPDYNPGDAQPADLALIQLETPVLTVAPAVLFDNTAVGLPLVTEKITLAGYGITSPGATDAGTLRIGTAHIAGSSGSQYFTERGNFVAFPGDSGGPSFLHDGLRETVVGIHHAYFDTGGFNYANIEVMPGAFRSFIDSNVADAVWGEQLYRVAQGPASSAELVVTQGAADLRARVVADGDIFALAGSAATSHPVGQWLISAPGYTDNGVERWEIYFTDYDLSAGTFLPLDGTQEYTAELGDIDWTGWDPINGVPRSLQSAVATLTIYDVDLSVAYTGQLDVALTDNDFFSAAFRPIDLVPQLTDFGAFLLNDIVVTAPVPEPATAAVLIVSLFLAGHRRRRRGMPPGDLGQATS